MTTLVVDTVRELRRRVDGATADGLPGAEHYRAAAIHLEAAADALQRGHEARAVIRELTDAETELRGEAILARERAVRRGVPLRGERHLRAVG